MNWSIVSCFIARAPNGVANFRKTLNERKIYQRNDNGLESVECGGQFLFILYVRLPKILLSRGDENCFTARRKVEVCGESLGTPGCRLQPV